MEGGLPTPDAVGGGGGGTCGFGAIIGFTLCKKTPPGKQVPKQIRYDVYCKKVVLHNFGIACPSSFFLHKVHT